MTATELQTLRYPIGKYQPPSDITSQVIDGWIDTIDQHPARLSQLVSGLNDSQLDTPYRPEGWTIRQVIHHLPDSHANSYVRFKWSLTEDKPMIKAYKEALWAELPDGKSAPIALSLHMLDALHARWVYFLRNMEASDFRKSYFHPETQKEVFLDWNLGLYAWHCDHHYAHIERLMQREGWR